MTDNGQLSGSFLNLFPTTPQVSTEYEIRVLDTRAEHLASYRLRHDSQSPPGPRARANGSGLELDEFDPYSVPVGAFDLSSGSLIGMLRIVTRTRQPHHERLIRRIVANHDDVRLARQALGPVPHPLPSIVSESIRQCLAAFSYGRPVLYELDRIIVQPDHRGSHLSRALVAFGLAYGALAGPTTIVGTCPRGYLAMYARYGFTRLPHTDLYHGSGQTSYVLAGRTDALPQPIRGHVDDLLEAMRSGAADRAIQITPEARVRCVVRSAAGERGGTDPD